MAADASTLLLEEHFSAEDDRFLDEVFASTSGKKLKSLAERWYRDRRPYARRMLLRYIDDGCDRPHHRPLVKNLFKLAEAAQDDEALGHFLVAFDRLVQRTAKTVRAWDPDTRTTTPQVVFRKDPNVEESVGNRDTRSPRFSRVTRNYLRRRAFRYFRGIARRDTPRYGSAIRNALLLYQDDHFQKPEQILDAWGLIHILYWGSDVIERNPRGVVISKGRSLADLEPAPFCPQAWEGCLDALIELLEKAQCRTVRVFGIAVARQHYASDLSSIKLSKIRGLLRSPHDEVQAFAAELLRTATGVENLSLQEWLDLLKIDNPMALTLLCDLVKKLVSPQRLSLAQCIDLACARPAPVAELGLQWAQKKSVESETALITLLGLARAQGEHVRQEGMAWVLRVLEASKAARPEHLRDLLDSRYADARAQALALFEKSPRFSDNTVLWAALSESPYPDVRSFLVKHLQERQSSFSADALRMIWITTLLAVHRGGRDKRTALNQVADRVVRDPNLASSLLPLLAIALRSVRPAERHSALAAVASAAFRAPPLRGAIAQHLPDLRFESEQAV